MSTQDNSYSGVYKCYNESYNFITESELEDFFVEDGARKTHILVSYLPEDYQKLRDFLSQSSESLRPRGLVRSVLEENLSLFDNAEDFWSWAEVNLIPLLLKPYVVLKLTDYLHVYDRGIVFRAKVSSLRIKQLLEYAYSRYKSHFYVRKHKTRHLVITVTIPHTTEWKNASEVIKRRLREVIRYFKRKYGVLFYLAVLELHADSYPHFHCLLVTKRKLRVFKHKGMWRFSSKRSWDKDLKASEKGFIDCFALRGGKKAITRYFMKYVNKFYVKRLKQSQETQESSESQDIQLNIKENALIYARIFRIRPVYHSRIPRITPEKKEEKPLSQKEINLLNKLMEYERLKANAKTIQDYLILEKMKTELMHDLIDISPILNRSSESEKFAYLLFLKDFLFRQYAKQNKIYQVMGYSCKIFTSN